MRQGMPTAGLGLHLIRLKAFNAPDSSVIDPFQATLATGLREYFRTAADRKETLEARGVPVLFDPLFNEIVESRLVSGSALLRARDECG
jgi:hypothetical protein